MKIADKVIRRLIHSRLLILCLAVFVLMLETKSSTIFLREYQSFCNPLENTVYLSACENSACQQAFVEERSLLQNQLIRNITPESTRQTLRLMELFVLLLLFGATLVFELVLYQKTCFLFGDPPSLIQLILKTCDKEDGKKRSFPVHKRTVCAEHRLLCLYEEKESKNHDRSNYRNRMCSLCSGCVLVP